MGQFGPYTEHELLGAGGMATVHRATLELEDGSFRDVALKRLLPQHADDRQFVEDFIREAKLAANLQHPNIVRILELGRIGGTYFMAMELVRGESMLALLRRGHQQQRPAPIGVVLALAGELCDALDHAHELQIVHRDLTPSNLLITDYGHLKVIDYGVAKALTGDLQTSSGLAKGKLGYMSPEAIGGKHVDPRTDLFSAGVVMWELLAGRRLFSAPTEYELLVKLRDLVVPPPSQLRADCPEELDSIVLRAIARSLDERWPSAAAMGEAIEALRQRAGEGSSAREVVQWKKQLRDDPPRGPRSRRESETETTAMRLPTEDVIAEDEIAEIKQPDEIAEGSQRAERADAGVTYEEPIEELDSVAVRPVVDDAGGPPAHGSGEADTVVDSEG